MRDTLKVLKHYPYRTCRVFGGTSLPREVMARLEDHLCKLAGVSKDNHTVFLVEDLDYNVVAVMFHDLECCISKDYREGMW